MSRQFAEMDKVLKNAKFSKSKNSLLARLEEGQYLYQMPWYVVLGAAGSGKTTALKRSGLKLPFREHFRDICKCLAGTRDCDWFLSDEIVFLIQLVDYLYMTIIAVKTLATGKSL